ncbi:MAG: glycosyltransferase [Patescibacteria group bacterium]|nr:glycosyltransferase [Patescibacteria group bacterium]
MNIITLIPVKNEEWIIGETLKNLSSFSDFIIVADQHSTDRTREICADFPKVKVIDNPANGHNNAVRWLLLDEARKIEGNNLIFCIDADEMLSPHAVEEIRRCIATQHLQPGVGFSFSWIQLFGSVGEYRIDGAWKRNIKPIAFWDDRKMDYERTIVINDHTGRIPAVSQTYYMDKYPLLHFQAVSKERSEMKQIWYQCAELIQNPTNARKINNKYAVANQTRVQLAKTPTAWLLDVEPALPPYDEEQDWHYRDIVQWFNQYGIAFFEPLDIWHNRELCDLFIQIIGRKPRPKRYPRILVILNKLKHALR